MHTHALAAILGTVALAPAASAGPLTVPLTLVERSADSSLVRHAGQTQQFNATVKYDLTTTISLGTPPQAVPLVVAFDFGDLLVLGDAGCALTKAPGTCAGTPIFTPADSTSYRQQTAFTTGDYFLVDGGVGSVEGHTATERVQLGGGAGDMRIMVGESEKADSTGLRDTNVNAKNGAAGVLGLGFQSELAKQVNPAPWRSIAASWDEPVVGLRTVRTEPQGTTLTVAGNLTFGGIEDGAVQDAASIKYVDQASDAKDWTIAIDGISVNGSPVPNVQNTAGSPASSVKGSEPGTPLRMQIEPSRAFLTLPEAILEAIFKMIPGASKTTYDDWEIPCEPAPVISLRIGGQDYPLKTTDWLNKPRSADPSRCRAVLLQSASLAVYGSYTLGQVFLVNYYTVFKVSPTLQIGFGQLSSSAQDDVYYPDGPPAGGSSATPETLDYNTRTTTGSNTGGSTAFTLPSSTATPSGASVSASGAQGGSSHVPGAIAQVAAALAAAWLAAA